MDWVAVGAGCGALGLFLLMVGVMRARVEMRR